MSTLSMSHEAISKALCENLPLTDDQRAALLSLVAADKRGQELWDASARWQPIETAPENMDALAVVGWVDSDGQEHHDLDHKEDGCWQRWHDHAEHVEMIGGWGVSYTAPYTRWMPLPAAA